MKISTGIIKKQLIQFECSLPVKYGITVSCIVKNIDQGEAESSQNFKIEMVIVIFKFWFLFVVFVHKKGTDNENQQPSNKGNNIHDTEKLKHTY
ncbi:hypothetical protein D3C80_1884330 [compost metagenome]